MDDFHTHTKAGGNADEFVQQRIATGEIVIPQQLEKAPEPELNKPEAELDKGEIAKDKKVAAGVRA